MPTVPQLWWSQPAGPRKQWCTDCPSPAHALAHAVNTHSFIHSFSVASTCSESQCSRYWREWKSEELSGACRPGELFTELNFHTTELCHTSHRGKHSLRKHSHWKRLSAQKVLPGASPERGQHSARSQREARRTALVRGRKLGQVFRAKRVSVMLLRASFSSFGNDCHHSLNGPLIVCSSLSF